MNTVKVIETTLGSGPRAKPGPLLEILECVLRAVIPPANPDFERCYERIHKWWIEINETGEPQRELGFDEEGKVIAAGPMGRNFGYFTDSNAVFARDEHPAVEQAAFDSAWAEFENRQPQLALVPDRSCDKR